MMHKLELTSRTARKARTRTLIGIGGLASKAGLLDTFGIILGEDLQKSPPMKEQAAALFKGFLILNEMARSGEIDQQLCSAQGLAALRKLKEQNSLKA